jgi:hypothetical protein
VCHDTSWPEGYLAVSSIPFPNSSQGPEYKTLRKTRGSGPVKISCAQHGRHWAFPRDSPHACCAQGAPADSNNGLCLHITSSVPATALNDFLYFSE